MYWKIIQSMSNNLNNFSTLSIFPQQVQKKKKKREKPALSRVSQFKNRTIYIHLRMFINFQFFSFIPTKNTYSKKNHSFSRTDYLSSHIYFFSSVSAHTKRRLVNWKKFNSIKKLALNWLFANITSISANWGNWRLQTQSQSSVLRHFSSSSVCDEK